jgi:LuxR family transcriptional regulator, maltose regulon positive regulatory protein
LKIARERGVAAVALAERYGLDDRPILAPALGMIASQTIWMGEFEAGERWLQRAWEVAEPQVDPAAAVLLHLVSGMLHAGRGQHRSALEEFTAGARANSLLSGMHAFLLPMTGWLAAAQARLGMTGEARATLDEFSDERQGRAVAQELVPLDALYNARAVICLVEEHPAAALDVLRALRDVPPPVDFPAFALVEAHLLAGIAHLDLANRDEAAAAAEAALQAAEPDRLILPFAMTRAADLLDVLARHQTAHGALVAEIVDLLRGEPIPSRDPELPSHADQLSPGELRVLRLLPTNLTRPEIARELYVSVHTVNTHIRKIYSKLGARDRTSAVQRARERRLLSTGRSERSPQ